MDEVSSTTDMNGNDRSGVGRNTTGNDDASDLAASLNDEESQWDQHWRESPYAVGLVSPTWKGPYRQGWVFRLAGCICNLVGARKVGHMAVLLETEPARQSQQDTNHNNRLLVVMGPYWPCMLFCTLPLILLVSMWVLMSSTLLSDQHPAVLYVWVVLTGATLLSLLLVSCRDPGILRRRSAPVEGWIWNDQGLTFRPPTAKYDKDCGVVVEEFDHT